MAYLLLAIFVMQRPMSPPQRERLNTWMAVTLLRRIGGYFFGGGFFGDYTDIAAGSDDRFHAFWTDSNNVQNIDW
jgi:hypothetical protein